MRVYDFMNLVCVCGLSITMSVPSIILYTRLMCVIKLSFQCEKANTAKCGWRETYVLLIYTADVLMKYIYERGRVS